MLKDFNKKLESYLNSDAELQRRLKGFKTFSGIPDGHYRRARAEGEKTIARAVRCYPFGGKSSLDGHEIISIRIVDNGNESGFVISLRDKNFSVSSKDETNPFLSLELSKDTFKKALLGRYRWIWIIGMDEVNVKYSDELPHSDWVTIFEILVAMQEIAEFDIEMREKIEKWK